MNFRPFLLLPKSLLIVAAFLVTARPARAQFGADPGLLLKQKRETGIRLGKWTLHPNVLFYGVYDTNVLYASAAARDDFGFQLSPGVDLILNVSRAEVLLGYRFKRIEQKEFNVQDYNAHSAFVRATYHFSRRFLVRVEETVEKTSDPADVEIPERIGRITNQASAEVMHRTAAEDLETSLRYTHTYQRYDFNGAGVASLGSNVAVTSRINLASRFRFLPKSVLQVSGEYGATDFGGPGTAGVLSDSQGFTASAGINSQFSRRFSLVTQVGYSALYFDSGNDTHAVVGSVLANQQFSERFTVEAGYQRKLEQSSFTEYYNEHTFSLGARARITRKLDAGVRNSLSYVDFSGPSLLANGQNREDRLYQVEVNLDYALRPWLKPRALYTFMNRDSNATNPFFNSQSADFSKHRISLGVEVYY